MCPRCGGWPASSTTWSGPRWGRSWTGVGAAGTWSSTSTSCATAPPGRPRVSITFSNKQDSNVNRGCVIGLHSGAWKMHRLVVSVQFALLRNSRLRGIFIVARVHSFLLWKRREIDRRFVNWFVAMRKAQEKDPSRALKQSFNRHVSYLCLCCFVDLHSGTKNSSGSFRFGSLFVDCKLWNFPTDQWTYSHMILERMFAPRRSILRL